MKQRNPVAVWLGLPLITLGIYYYVWLYKVHSELGMFDRRLVNMNAESGLSRAR